MAHEPCLLVVFGATGDLMHQKLIPALHKLHERKMLPAHFSVVGVARREKTNEQFRKEVLASAKRSDKAFAQRFYYHQAEFTSDEGFGRLKKFLDELHDKQAGNTVFYLAAAPDFFPEIVKRLSRAKIVKKGRGWHRVVFEKPFGSSLASAESLHRSICRVFPEESVYRIDHYLGKEAVQNLLSVRFANGMFESLWNRDHIDHIQITGAETLGVGRRGEYYEDTGALRDMVQSHLLQLLMLIAMEPPKSLASSDIHDAKVRVLDDIALPTPAFISKNVVRGQYGAGKIGKERTAAYREEKNVTKDSHTETFAALKLHIDNQRWQGVPFYLRTGKRLAQQTTEIKVQFKAPPSPLFADAELKNNSLVIRIQPEEGVSLRFNVKTPDETLKIRAVEMEFCHSCLLGPQNVEAYERLLHDVMAGDTTLFTRWDEVRRSWQIVDPIVRSWRRARKIPLYAAGSWGPKEAQDLIERDDRRWTPR